MSFRLSAVAAFALLAACATPQEACISQAQADVRALEARIATAQGNIERGYAIHRQSVPYTYVDVCFDDTGTAYQCQQNATRIEETPVTIDVAEERAKLARYRAQLPALRAKAQAQIAQCRLTYPE